MVSLSIRLCGLEFLSKLIRVLFFHVLFISLFYVELSHAELSGVQLSQDMSEAPIEQKDSKDIKRYPSEQKDSKDIKRYPSNNQNIVFYPLLRLDYGYNSNVNSHPQNGDGAFSIRVSPSLSVIADFYPHSITLDASLSQGLYLGSPQKQGVKAELDLDAKLEVANGFHLNPLLAAGIEYETPAEGNLPQNTAQNVQKKYFQSGLGITKQFGRITTSTGFYYTVYDFRDTTTSEGELIEQDPRDVEILNGILRFDYMLSKRLDVFVQFEHKRYSHPNSSVTNIDLNFNNNILLFGASFGGDVVNGYAALGYSKADYRQSLTDNVDAIVYMVNLKYKASPKVETSINANSTITNTTIVNTFSKRVTNLSLKTDYSFSKELVLSPKLVYQLNDYKGSEQNDKKYSIGLSASYKISPSIVAGFDYSFTRGDYLNNDFDYRSHYIGSFFEFSN